MSSLRPQALQINNILTSDQLISLISDDIPLIILLQPSGVTHIFSKVECDFGELVEAVSIRKIGSVEVFEYRFKILLASPNRIFPIIRLAGYQIVT